MYKVEIEQESDGRWIAEVPELPGVMTYGQSREEAIRRAQALALHVLADLAVLSTEGAIQLQGDRRNFLM